VYEEEGPLSCIIVMHNFACVKSGHLKKCNTRFYGHYVFFSKCPLLFLMFFPLTPGDTLFLPTFQQDKCKGKKFGRVSVKDIYTYTGFTRPNQSQVLGLHVLAGYQLDYIP
jgi:hypothetical protein